MAQDIVRVLRLHPDQLRALREQCGGGASSAVTNNTTPHMAGFQLGVQHVLQKLSDGFTIEVAPTGGDRLATD